MQPGGNTEPIKVFDIKGEQKMIINDSILEVFFIDIYYDPLLNKSYIITGNINLVTSFDYDKNQKYNEYYEENDNNLKEYHKSFVITKNENITKLIESSSTKYIKIFNFHSGEILNKIKLGDSGDYNLYSICLWNEDNLFIASGKSSILKDGPYIILIDLQKKNNIKYIKTDHNDRIISIKKLIHPKYGECLLSQGIGKDKIKLWKN